MLNKAWMILSLLIGNVLLISIAMSNPMYTSAVTQNLLTRMLADAHVQTGVYPAVATMEGARAKSRGDSADAVEYETAQADIRALPGRLNTPALHEIAFHSVEDVTGIPLINRSDEGANVKLTLSTMTGLSEQAEIIAGGAYSAEPDANGVYDVLVGRTAFIRKNLVLGEEIRYPYVQAPDGNPLTLRIAGVFASTDDIYWVDPESAYPTQVFLDPALFEQLFFGEQSQAFAVKTLWTTLFDIKGMRAEDVPGAIDAISELNARYNRVYIRRFNTGFETLLRAYQTEANQASATLKVLEAPVFALLIAFMLMVSRQILEIEKNEIAVLKSRGASSAQVLGVYILQSLLIAALAFAISLPVSAFLCRAIGSARAFLVFDARAALAIRYTPAAFLFGIAAALAGILTMALPAVSYARLTIVDSKRAVRARSQTPWWQRYGLDFILLGVSLYGLYAFNNQKPLLAARVAEGAALDPLIYIASSLFAVGASLVAVRVIPLLAQAVFAWTKNSLRPSMYASFMQILRARRNQTFMMTFLMLTIAIGILNADTACTVNNAEIDQLRYDLGADIVLKEAWTRANGEYTETDAARYEQIPGVTSMAKVLRDDQASASAGKATLSGVTLFGIDTKAFGETAYMKDGLLDPHFFHYLNEMSQTPNHCLVSENFRESLGMDIGDSIQVKTADSAYMNLSIAGFVPYFPTYNPTAYRVQEDGVARLTDRYLVVANYGYLESAWGTQPYEIWLKSPISADAVYDFANAGGARYWAFRDVYTQLDALKNAPAIQGTNGILTLSFIVGLMLCAAGFLIFWTLSIESRSLQFGIYRAMGMSVGEIVAMLINEHIWQSALPILCGAGIGWLVSTLYIPLIQIAYSSADASLPLAVTRDVLDHARLYIIIALVLLLCICVLVARIRRLKVAQALKLGED
jgi:putative ABC transport system permease protein